jgi:hypothetical protein
MARIRSTWKVSATAAAHLLSTLLAVGPACAAAAAAALIDRGCIG